jgi:hypothetical protein
MEYILYYTSRGSVFMINVTKSEVGTSRFGRPALRIALLLLAVALSFFVLSATLTELPGEDFVPAGMK